MGAFIYLINTPDAWAPIVCWAYPWGPGSNNGAPRPLGPRALVVITGPQGPRAPGPLGPMGPNAPVKKMKIFENPIFS